MCTQWSTIQPQKGAKLCHLQETRDETIKQNKPDSKRKMSCAFPRMQNKDVKYIDT